MVNLHSRLSVSKLGTVGFEPGRIRSDKWLLRACDEAPIFSNELAAAAIYFVVALAAGEWAARGGRRARFAVFIAALAHFALGLAGYLHWVSTRSPLSIDLFTEGGNTAGT